MGLFKSGKSKADDLLSILIPSLEWEIKEEIKKRLLAQMDDVVREAANQVIRYGYKEAIKELTIQVRAPKREWVGLTDEQRQDIKGRWVCGEFESFDICLDDIEAKLKEKNT